eukprot:m.90353 g.90353  ORF g.90353 m.90353 type:complete len:302 (+) comp51097_c0_seq1:294-1199(+)
MMTSVKRTMLVARRASRRAARTQPQTSSPACSAVSASALVGSKSVPMSVLVAMMLLSRSTSLSSSFMMATCSRLGDILCVSTRVGNSVMDQETMQVLRSKPVAETIAGKRQCNCRVEMKTVQVGPGSFQMHQQQVCDECENKRLVTQYREIQVDIEAGMVDGQEITFYGEGEPHIDGDHGDLKVKVKALKHPRFTRIGDDLFTNMTITLRDALTGFETTIKHLDDHDVKVSSSQIIAHGHIMKIAQEGMKNFHNNLQAGDLYITFAVEFPSSISTSAHDDLIGILGQASKQRSFNGLDKFN